MDTYAGNNQDPITLHKYIYGNADPVTYTDPTGNFGMAELNVGLSIVGAGFSGWSIGTGINKISEGNYQGGFIDIGLGFMGSGVLAKAPFAINGASKLLASHRATYLAMLDDLGKQVIALQKSGKTSKQIAEWAVNRRNEIKDIVRRKMVSGASTKTEKAWAIAANKWAEARNYLKYGDKLGPKVEWFVANKNKGYDAVIEGATKASDVTRFFSTTGWGLLP